MKRSQDICQIQRRRSSSLATEGLYNKLKMVYCLASLSHNCKRNNTSTSFAKYFFLPFYCILYGNKENN